MARRFIFASAAILWLIRPRGVVKLTTNVARGSWQFGKHALVGRIREVSLIVELLSRLQIVDNASDNHVFGRSDALWRHTELVRVVPRLRPDACAVGSFGVDPAFGRF